MRWTLVRHALRPRVLLAIVLAITAGVYWQIASHEFVHYDDPWYITDNPIVQQGLTADGVGWAFGSFAASNWHPLTWLSHMLDIELWDQRPGPHLLTNLLLHLVNTALVFVLFRRMTADPWRSLLVAALFALHPFHVESVAWVAERKDVLSTMVGLLAIACYATFARSARPLSYVLMLVLYALSLLSKPMLVTLPFALLLLDWWPLRRFGAMGGQCSVRALIIEKLPLLAMAALSCVVTVLAQRLGGAVATLESIPLGLRVENAIVAYVLYIAKAIWPVHLAVIYPHPYRWETWQVVCSALVLVVISGIALARSRKQPHLIVGWLWFLGTLAPVIGIVQVGLQSMADRYTYVPLLGLFVMVIWSLPRTQTAASKLAVGAIACVVLAVLSAATALQIRHWRNSEALFLHAIEATHGNYIAHLNLAHHYEQQRRLDDAIAHYRACLDIKPRYASAHSNLGNVLLAQRQYDDAITHHWLAIEIDPDKAEFHSNIATALLQKGMTEESIAEYHHALRIDPEFAPAHAGLGVALAGQNELREAIDSFRRALELKPQMSEVRIELAKAHCEAGIQLAQRSDFNGAIAHFEEAVRIEPNYPQAQLFLQRALEDRRAMQGK